MRSFLHQKAFRLKLMGNIASAVAIRSDLNHVVAHAKKLMKNYLHLLIELGLGIRIHKKIIVWKS